jgi:hypothetical protein
MSQPSADRALYQAHKTEPTVRARQSEAIYRVDIVPIGKTQAELPG